MACHHCSFLVVVINNEWIMLGQIIIYLNMCGYDISTRHMKNLVLLNIFFISMDENLISFAEGSHWNSIFFNSLSSFLHPGIWAQIQMPQTSMNVTKGQMVVLRASYTTEPGSDLSTNTILWNFVSDNTQLVRKWMEDLTNSPMWKTSTWCLLISSSMSSII